MAIFHAPFSAVAVTAAQDVFEIVASATSRVVIREVRLGQYSDAGDAAAELLAVTMTRGFTTSGSGGGTITPVNVSGTAGAASAGSTVERNNTTQASTSGTLIYADAWNVQAPFLWLPSQGDQVFLLEAGQRFVVSITAPADSLTMNGTLVFEEIGSL